MVRVRRTRRWKRMRRRGEKYSDDIWKVKIKECQERRGGEEGRRGGRRRNKSER